MTDTQWGRTETIVRPPHYPVYSFGAVFYSDKLSEEVRKGMLEKMEQGIYPGRPPFGYRNNKGERTIET